MGKKVAIVGAGPTGLLLAHYLLRRDAQYQIDIYERRSDPNLVPFSERRSYPIALFERGMSALRNVGLEEAIKTQGIEIKYSLLHEKNGKTRLLSRKNPITNINRNTLAITLWESLTQKFDSNQVRIHFDCQCSQVDFEAKIATFKTKEREQFTIEYDLLIGADGARSAVRKHFLDTERFEFKQKYLSDVYKILFLPRINDRLNLDLELNTIHGWRLDDGTRIMLAPQAKDSLSCIIVFDRQKNSIASLRSQEEVIQFFQKHSPEIAKLVSQEEAEAFLARPISHVMTVWCNSYHYGDSVLLLGDAAHALSPSLGQGCNSALEDVVILDKLLDEYSDNWADALPQFTLRRIKDAHAVQELSENAFPRSKRLFIEFVLRRQFTRLINKIFPKYQFFSDLLETTIPYSEILNSAKGWVSRVKKSNQKLSIEDTPLL